MKMKKQIQEAETSSETSKADKTYFEEVNKKYKQTNKKGPKGRSKIKYT